MDSESALRTILWILSVALMGFAAAAEVSLASISRSVVRELVDEGVSRAQAVSTLLEQPGRFLSALLVLKVAAAIAAGGAATLLALDFGGGWQMVSAALLFTAVALLLTQIVLRGMVLRSPDTMALYLAYPVQWATTALTPVTWLLRTLAVRIRGNATGNASQESIFLSEDGLRFLIDMGEEQTHIEEEEKEMIASIFEFGETLVREVMVPRIDVTALEADTSVEDALDTIIQCGHSRIPVFEEHVDNIVGVLYAKDLLRAYRDVARGSPVLNESRSEERISIRDLLRPAYFVPESKKVDELLHELQQRKVHIVIVVDEYGGTAGLATIEDLLEEIVGEIQDEYDAEVPFVEQLSEHEFYFNARIDLDKVSKLIGVEFPAEGADTLGGFVYSQLGKVPEEGETIEFDGVNICVLGVKGRRIDRICVRRVTSPTDGEEEVASGEQASATASLLSMFTLR